MIASTQGVKMKYGFTFIEFMIVVAIVGIIVAAAWPQYVAHKCKTKGKCSNVQPLDNQPLTMCIAGFQFLRDGKTQVLNQNGGGVPCQFGR